MESSEDVELINRAIQKLLEEAKIKDSGKDDDQLLSRLFSQLESLKEDSTQKQSDPEKFYSPRDDDDNDDNDKGEAKGENGCGCGINAEELSKELKEIKRQNTITHFLVSAMIVVTLIWQVSEASLVLKVSNGVTHPFKSLGSWFLDKLKRPIKQQQDQVREAIEASSGSGLSVQFPEFPHLGSNGEGH